MASIMEQDADAGSEVQDLQWGLSEAKTDPVSEAMMSALQTFTLSQLLQAPALRCHFLNNIFDTELAPSMIQQTDNGYEAFFNRYFLLCKVAANKNREIEKVTHWQMAKIISVLHDRALTKGFASKRCVGPGMILDGAFPFHDEDKILFDLSVILIELAAGVWLMLSIGNFPGDVSYDEPIEWGLGERLSVHRLQDALLTKHFSSVYDLKGSVKLPQTFTAAHLEQIGGIEVIWTSNLADHLLLKDDDTRLMLFHQVSILHLHLVSTSSILPKTLVDETIRSISLLIPPILGEPNPWFQQQRKKYPIDASAGVCDRLNSSERQIDKFTYWRDRLVLLKRTFDDAEPRNISQLWWDDRKKTQWFTFWVAVLVFIMTVFFGVIQSVAGIVQAWASVQSLRAQSTPTPGPYEGANMLVRRI